MAALPRFDPPGFLDDLTPSQRRKWSDVVSRWLNSAREGNAAQNDGPRQQFFNQLTKPPAADAQVAVISWNAFPRQLRSNALSDRQRWRRADSDRNLQDEYCEWSVTRDPASNKITRVTFTCEGPEYWSFLARQNPDKVVELYKQFISPSIARKDLFVDRKYNPYNRYNSTTSLGAMHLIQPANTLSAEIELAAAATIRRMRDGLELTGAQDLIGCSLYGEPGRNSDPFIGEQVNALARQKADITLNNPVGLYLHGFNPVGWTTPDGTDPRDFWKYVRGKNDHFVRAVFEVPAGRGYVVGDIKSGGKAIEFGAQIADFITIKLEGLATRLGQSTVQPVVGCHARAQAPGGFVAGPPAEADEQDAALGSRAGSGAIAAPPAAMAELPERLRRALHLDEEAGLAAPPALLPYPRLPDSKLATVGVCGAILAYASPDSTYAVTKRLLDSAQKSIVIGIYDFSAVYMKEQLKAAMRRGVSIALMLDTNSSGEQALFEELTALGATCVMAPSSSSGNPIAYFGYAHEKIIVVDREIVMIQSGNWSENSIPFNEGDGVRSTHFMWGNRDMGLAMHSPELAALFADLVARDMRLAQGQPPDATLQEAALVAAEPTAASEIFFEAAPPRPPAKLFPSLSVTPSTPVPVTPVITPENFHQRVKQLLRSARRTVRIEQQYIRGGQDAVTALLQELKAAREDSPDLDIRIIVSPKFLLEPNKGRFFQLMREFSLEFDDNFRFLSPLHFVHCHNKLIVVDDEKLLLGSQNWSTTGLLSNREASLLVEHAGIACYFGRIFDADWTMSEPSAAPPDEVLAGLVGGLVDASDFARGGVALSTTRDYEDV